MEYCRISPAPGNRAQSPRFTSLLARYSLAPLFLLIAFTGYDAFAIDTEGDIIEKARSLIGTPYRYGSSSPGGFDCSGLVYYLYSPHLPRLPRSSRQMANIGASVPTRSLAPGDLLFFETIGEGRGISHVAIYSGNGTIIHSVSNGPETGVVESKLDARYWQQTLSHARRVLPGAIAEAQSNTPDTGAGGASGDDRSDGTIAAAAEPARRDSPGIKRTEQSSPWDTFEGVVYGDYEQWRAKESEEFEAFKRSEREYRDTR